MRKISIKILKFFIVFFLGFVILQGCGYKGDPVYEKKVK